MLPSPQTSLQYPFAINQPNPLPSRKTQPAFRHRTLVLKKLFKKSKMSFKFHGTDANSDKRIRGTDVLVNII